MGRPEVVSGIREVASSIPVSVDRRVGWLATGSVEELRLAVSEVLPDSAGRPLVVHDRIVTSNPRYFQGTAVLGGAYVVKYAWSEAAARRIAHEARLLEALADTQPDLPVPAVVATAVDPALLITRLVAGEPFSWEAANGLCGEPRRRLVEDLAGFLAVLHDPETLEAVGAASRGPEGPEAQATTEVLRANFGKHVNASRQLLVEHWCDWVDSVLSELPDEALVQGDLHGHNLVWEPNTGALRLVVDFENAGPADPAFDFRYLPGHARTIDVFVEVHRHYEHRRGRTLDINRVMAWHVLTVLGDALWRADAGIALPGGGGTPSSWVDELDTRLRSILQQ